MQRCVMLAKKGAGYVSPNPMVGCVIVHNNKIIGEGYHQKHGEAHAEVNAINAVKNPALLTESTLYVSLEPCAHHGLTPPCSDLIVRKKIPRVVIGTIDSFAKVAGKGIEKLKAAGIDVSVGILENECRDLNRRFFTYYEKKRPYIFLKWAQTRDGFIDIDRSSQQFGQPTWITGQDALVDVHQMRAREDAILVGTNTAEKDNPSLTVRHCPGKNPVRVVIDNQLRLPRNLHLFDNSVKTLVFNSIKNQTLKNTIYIRIDFEENLPRQILNHLFEHKIQSVIIEGGRQLLQTFIDDNLWDEAFIYTGDVLFNTGIKTPEIEGDLIETKSFGTDRLQIFNRTQVINPKAKEPSGRLT